MKALVTTLMASYFLMPFAHALLTKDCPNNIKISYSQFEFTKNVDQVLNVLEPSQANEATREFVQEAFENAGTGEYISRDLYISSRKNGRCVYRGNTEEKIELYSENGIDRLISQTDIAPRGMLLRLSAKIESLTPENIEISSESPGIALAIPRYPSTEFRAGGDIISIGHAHAFAIAPGN